MSYWELKTGRVWNLCCYCSVAQSFLILWDLINCSTRGFPVLHYLPEFAQTHVHWVNDAIQPSHLLSPSSPTALNLSQHQGLFQWISCSHQVTKLLELQLQFSTSPSSEYSGLISFRMDWFDLLAVQGTLKSLSNTVQKHQFFGAQPSLWSNSHIHMWLLEKP